MAGDDVVLSIHVRRMAGADVVLSTGEEEQPEALAELKSKFEELKQEATKGPETQKSRFPRVTKLLGGDSDKCHEPNVISFGPYHYGKEHLRRGETIKLKLAAAYIKKSEKTVDYFYEEIKSIIKDLKDGYDEESTKKYSDEKFSVMMLVDGCSLLRYMFSVCTSGFEEDFNISYHDLSLLNRDALLLENQLPFQLLSLLCTRSDPFLMLLCLEFIRMNNRDSYLQKYNYDCRLSCLLINNIINRQPQQSRQRVEEYKPCHLLDLFRRYILGDEGSSRSHTEAQRLKDVANNSVEEAMKGDFLSFRNVKELMTAGISIKRSYSGCLKDISFTSKVITACLRLPPFTIDNSTKALFFNLIAYEMSTDVPHDFISYLRFLDSLIDHADDVKELQSAGVLQNNLGTCEDVAKFFNTVSANLESNFHAYQDVRVKIRKHLKRHYNSRLRMWMTECLDTYCRSPWTIIACVGAALALFFTAVQTYLSVFHH